MTPTRCRTTRRLVVADLTVTAGPKSTSTEQLMWKYTLSSDGSTLAAGCNVDRRTISSESKRVFVGKGTERRPRHGESSVPHLHQQGQS